MENYIWLFKKHIAIEQQSGEQKLFMHIVMKRILNFHIHNSRSREPSFFYFFKVMLLFNMTWR